MNHNFNESNIINLKKSSKAIYFDEIQECCPYCFSTNICKEGNLNDEGIIEINCNDCRAEWTEPIEHNPDKCGCSYLGNEAWTCGHVDKVN